MMLLRLAVIFLCTFISNVIYTQDVHCLMSVALDTVDKTVSVQADFQLQYSVKKDTDTLWFHLPVYAFKEKNSAFSQDILKIGHTDFHFRNASQMPEVKDILIYADQKVVHIYKKPGTDAFFGVPASEVKSVRFQYKLKLASWDFGPSYKGGDFLLQYFYPVLANKDEHNNLIPMRLRDTRYIMPNKISCSIDFPDGYMVYHNGQDIKNIDDKIFCSSDNDLVILFTRKANPGGILKSDRKDIPYFSRIDLKKHVDFHQVLTNVFTKAESKLGTFPFESLMFITTASPYFGYYGQGVIIVPEPGKKEDIEIYLTRHLIRLWIGGKFLLQNTKDAFLLDGISGYVSKEILNAPTINKRGKVIRDKDVESLREYQKMRALPGLSTDEAELNRTQIYLNSKVRSRLFIAYLASLTGKSHLDKVLRTWDKTSEKLTIESLFLKLEKESGKSINDEYIKNILDKNRANPETLDGLAYDRDGFPDMISGYKEKTTYIIPFPAYNDNDGWMAGLLFTNARPHSFKPFAWAVSPMYSFRQQKLLGQAWAQYDCLLQRDATLLGKVRFRVGLKSFDLDYNRKLDYTLRYVKLYPTVQAFFKHAYHTGVQSSVSLRWLNINEQRPYFDNGVFDDLRWNKSNIFQIEYEWMRDKTLSFSKLNIQTEYQKYGQENYLKLTSTVKYQWKYKSCRIIGVRLFAGGFIANTQRNVNSYQNSLVRGSLALIQHGFNDYTYDEYFLARLNQSGFQDRQVSLAHGGGFKTPVGSSYSIGMTNNYGGAINLFADVPFKTNWFPLQVYFDYGIYSRYMNQQFTNKTMYNGGLMLNYCNRFKIFVPLVFSEELGNIYREKHTNFLSRISFGINLEKFNFWQNQPLKIKKNKLI